LSGDDPTPVRHQVVELPEVTPLVDEYRLHQLRCPECGDVTRATLPAEVSTSGYGPRLVATVGLLSGPYRQSERQTQHARSVPESNLPLSAAKNSVPFAYRADLTAALRYGRISPGGKAADASSGRNL
jgi:hypothetical protein